LRPIEPGEELSYDYNLELEEGDNQDKDRYLCLCGMTNCRGTMLSPSSLTGRISK